jgi:AraC-like DNA-binding protein
VPNIDWLLREATEERALPTSERMRIDDARWRASIERIEIGPGLRVFLTDAEARRDIAVEARDDRRDRWVGSQVTLAGRAEIDFLDGVRDRATARHALLFRPSGRAATYSLAAGTRFHSAGYGLDVERFERLFDGAVPRPLRALLAPEVAASRVVPMQGDRSMRSLAAGLFARGLNGPLRLLMMEGVVIQLLAAQAAASERRPVPRPRPRFSAADREALHAAKALLLADMRHPPGLGALAAAVGLSEKRLNAGFRALFGATVFDCLRNERLEHARLALEEVDLTLKDVAFRVGYNHATNFISAFTARYGAPPRKYRDRILGARQPRRR